MMNNKSIKSICLLVLLIMSIGYIIILSIIYLNSGYHLGVQNVDLSTTYNYLVELGTGLTPIITIAAVLIYYITLTAQQKEIKQNQLRFEIQQFENNFFQMLENQKKIRNELELKDEFYTIGLETYKGSRFFAYSLFLMHYLILALKGKRSFIFRDWDEYIQEKGLLKTEEESREEQYYWEKDPEKYKEIMNDEKESSIIDYVSYKFKTKEIDFKKAEEEAKGEKEEAWYCKYAFQKIYYKHLINNDIYFKSLMDILLYIKSNSVLFDKLNESTKVYRTYLYTSMISSNMSQKELALLFYYAFLFDDENNLCVEYHLFDKLDSSNLLDISHSKLIRNLEIKNKQELYDSRKINM